MPKNMVEIMADIPVLSKNILVEELVRANRSSDFRSNIFLRSNGDFFKTDSVKGLANHLKSVGMEPELDKFELKYFNDFTNNNKTQKGYVLALKNPTADDAEDLMTKYLKGRKNYIDDKVRDSIESRNNAIDAARQNHPEAFIGLPGKEFFSDPLTIAKISRNDLLRDKIQSTKLSNDINSFEHRLDGSDSMTESHIAVYSIEPKPGSGLSKEAMISTIHSIYNTVEQKNEAVQDFDDAVRQQSFTEDGLNNFSENDLSYYSGFDRSEDDIDIGQYDNKSFAQETALDTTQYGDPVQNKSVVPMANSFTNKDGEHAQPEVGGAKQPNTPKQPQIKKNEPKFKDPALNNLVDRLTDKKEEDTDDDKSGKGKKNLAQDKEASAKIGEIIAATLAKILETLMLLLKMILQMLLAIFRRQNVIAAAREVWNDYHLKPTAKGSKADADNKKDLEKSLDNNYLKSLNNGVGFGLTNQNSKSPEMANVGNNSPPLATALAKPYELTSDTALAFLPHDRKEEVKALQFTPDETKALIQNVSVKKEHKVADGLPDVPPEFGYTLNHGALLTATDTVENKDGTQGAVLGAFEKDGELYYNVASKNKDGDIEIDSFPASDLTVHGYADSEFKDQPELVKKLNDSQNESLIEKHPSITLMNTPNPWDSEHKETIVSLADKGIPVVKGLTDIDYTNVKSFDQVKEEIAEKSKDEIFIAAMHTNKTSELRENINAHPLFGELLNVNDKVALNLPNSGRLSSGAVVGAFVNNDGDLKYQVKLDDGLITNVIAKDVAVLGYDQGGLTKGEIKTYAAGIVDSNKLKSIEKINLGSRIILSHEGTDSYANDYFVRPRAEVAEKFPNLKAGAQSLDSNGNQQGVGLVISHINENNKQEKFVTVGRFMKEFNGVEREVFMAMPTMTNPITFNTARNKHFLKDEPQFFAVDDPNVKIEANGITSKHLKEMVSNVSTFIRDNISKGKDDFIHTNSLNAYNTQESLLSQINAASMEEKEEKNLKAAVAYQQAYSLNQTLDNVIDVEVEVLESQTNNINAQYQNAVNSAQPLLLSQDKELTSPTPGNNQYPEKVEKTGEQYMGVDHADLTLVRVQRGIDGLDVNGKNLVLNHKMENPDSVRNTMHFTLNSVVKDHAYGNFDESKFAFIANLSQTSQENSISGVSPADTWFHAKDNKIVLPNATLIAPDTANIPEHIANSNVNIIRYQEGATPEETLANRNDAIKLELSDREVPFRTADMYGWSGHAFNIEDHKKLSASFGHEDNVLPTNHASSLDGDLEQSFAKLKVLQEDLVNGEKEYRTNSGESILTVDALERTKQEIQDQIALSNPIAQEFFTTKFEEAQDRLDRQLNPGHLMNESDPIQDYSSFSIPDNDAFIASNASDMQDPFIEFSNYDPSFDARAEVYETLEATSQEAAPEWSNTHVSEAVQPPPMPAPPVIQYNALGVLETSAPDIAPVSPTGFQELDQKLDNLRSFATGEINDTPEVYILNENREELLGLQNTVLKSGRALFESEGIKNEVDKIKDLSNTIDGALIKFEDEGVQVSYPNITHLKKMEANGNLSPELKDSVDQLLSNIASDPKLQHLAHNYHDDAKILKNYSADSVNQLESFAWANVKGESDEMTNHYRSYLSEEHKDVISKSLDHLNKEGSALLVAIGNSHENSYYVNAVANNNASNSAETLIEAQKQSEFASTLKTHLNESLTAASKNMDEPKMVQTKEKTQSQQFSM